MVETGAGKRGDRVSATAVLVGVAPATLLSGVFSIITGCVVGSFGRAGFWVEVLLGRSGDASGRGLRGGSDVAGSVGTIAASAGLVGSGVSVITGRMLGWVGWGRASLVGFGSATGVELLKGVGVGVGTFGVVITTGR